MNFLLDGKNLQKEENPTYLGVQLDRQLNLKAHVENVRKRAVGRLNLIKRLASSNWGSDKHTLRCLYLGYTRSIMDYNIVLQNLCSNNTKENLDKIQNHALRLICGGMRSSPTSACEISANVQPLELRRQKAALDLYERAKRMEKNHPCKQIVDDWKRLARLQQKSIMHVINDLQNKHHLPENRQTIERVRRDLPPNFELKSPIIKCELIDNVNKKSDPHTLKMSALETIDSYPKDWVHAYTDGSAFKATVNAGSGAIITYPDKETKEISIPCGTFCSNYVAEQEAINNTITDIKSKFDTSPETATNIVIFTDSISALQALDSEQDTSRETSKMSQLLNKLMNEHPIKVVLQWIPGHTGLRGNELADTLAKQGASLPQPDVPVSYETAVQIIKSNLQEEWLNSWATNATGRAVFNHMTKPNPKDPINKLQREEQSIIFRLRTGHVQLNNHLNRIKKDHPATCQLCLHPNETVEHHLFHCPKLQDLRERLLPQNPDIANTLYGSYEQLRSTSHFYYKASGRRANTHRPLVG